MSPQNADQVKDRAQLVRTNPLAYYRMVDAACRSGDSSLAVTTLHCTAAVVDIRNQLGAAAAQQLFATPQHVKSFLSATASWVKAYVDWLPPWKPAAPVTKEKRHEIISMLKCLGLVLVAAQGDGEGQGGGEGPAGQQGAEVRMRQQYCSSMELVLFWWLSRAVLAVAREMVAAGEYACSSSNKRSSRSSEGNLGSSCIIAAADNGSSTTVDTSSSNSGRVTTAGDPSSTGGSSSRVISDGTATHTSGTGISSSTRRDISGFTAGHASGTGSSSGHSTSSSSSFVVGGNGSGIVKESSACTGVEHKGRDNSGVPLILCGNTHISVAARCVILATLLQTSLMQWHTRASQQLPSASATAAADATAGSQTATSSDAVIADAAATAAGGHLSLQLPMRLSKLPQQGLPEAVVKILQRNSSRWPIEDVQNGVAVEDEEVQLQVLRDVVELCEVLQQEVPCPIGCNNPHCVDLKGMSEVVASGKVCTKCQVARYCSRECQVLHWDVHKAVCKRLQKEAAALLSGKPK